MKLIKFLFLAGILCVSLSACDDVTVEPISNTGEGRKLCRADYDKCIDPILHAQIRGSNGGETTCSASGCHDIDAGSGGGFKIFPEASDDQLLDNFNTVRAFANLNSPADSKLLLEPLDGISAISGTHTGGDIFPNTGDVCYQAIIGWISNQVDASDSMQSCGLCTIPDVDQCGF